MYYDDPIDPKTGLRGNKDFNGVHFKKLSGKQLRYIAMIYYFKNIRYKGDGSTEDAYKFIQEHFDSGMLSLHFELKWVNIDSYGRIGNV